jgi:riboflavin synthase
VFTGIVEELGTVVSVESTATGPDAAAVLRVQGPLVTSDVAPGDSIAVSGVCLTVVDVGEVSFTADVMRETLDRSALADTGAGSRVNLERAVTLSTRLGGHLVQGHVDGTGRLLERLHTPQWDVLRFSVPPDLAKYLVSKGSIAVDGVSLTVVDVVDVTDDEAGASFTVSLIPTTLGRTTLGGKQVGELVNLEVDVMAKYAERLLGESVSHLSRK